MKRFLGNAVRCVKWAAILVFVGLLGYFCPIGGHAVADSLFDDGDGDES